MVALAGCSALPPPPHPSAKPQTANPPAFAIAGESMEFRVELRGITVGRVRTAIGEVGWYEGKRSIIVRTRAESDGFISLVGKVAWELQSTIDLDRGFPIVAHEESWSELAGKPGHDDDTSHWSDGDDQHDVHSAVGRFRGWRSKPGDRFSFRARIIDAHLDIEAWHAGRDYLPLPNAHAIRYDGTISDKYQFSAWVSDDPSHVPLKFQTTSKWGPIVVELVAYHAP